MSKESTARLSRKDVDDLARASEQLVAVYAALQVSTWQGRVTALPLIFQANESIDRIASKGAAAIMRARAGKQGAEPQQATEGGRAENDAAGELGTVQGSGEVR